MLMVCGLGNERRPTHGRRIRRLSTPDQRPVIDQERPRHAVGLHPSPEAEKPRVGDTATIYIGTPAAMLAGDRKLWLGERGFAIKP